MTSALTSTRLIYVMDPLCSWCWGFEPVIQSLVELATEYRIPSLIRVGGLREESAPLNEKMRNYILKHWHAVHEKTRQPFNFDQAMQTGFIYNTEPACRALLTAQHLDLQQALNQPARIWRYLHQLQHAFYVENKNMTDPQVLTQLAAACGYPAESFSQLLNEDAIKALTQQEFAWVRQLPTSGFPSVFISQQNQLLLLTNGYQASDTLIPQFKGWLDSNA